MPCLRRRAWNRNASIFRKAWEDDRPTRADRRRLGGWRGSGRNSEGATPSSRGSRPRNELAAVAVAWHERSRSRVLRCRRASGENLPRSRARLGRRREHLRFRSSRSQVFRRHACGADGEARDLECRANPSRGESGPTLRSRSRSPRRRAPSSPWFPRSRARGPSARARC